MPSVTLIISLILVVDITAAFLLLISTLGYFIEELFFNEEDS